MAVEDMAVSISGPVGLRNRTQNVANLAKDQAAIIDLLAKIPGKQGGKRELWQPPPRPGADGAVPKALADAIWEFQSFWRGKGAFRQIDDVVDPGGNTLKRLNELADGSLGKGRVLTSSDQIRVAYPDLAPVTTSGSILAELSHYDIGDDELKPAHKDAIFTANLRAFGKTFRMIRVYGFHSNTGEPAFNLELARRRAQKAYRFAWYLGLVDVIMLGQWGFRPVPWRRGWPDGESAEMRKVVIFFRAGDIFDERDPPVGGITTPQRF